MRWWRGGTQLGRIAAAILVLIVGAAILAPTSFATGAGAALGYTLARFGWFYLSVVFAVLVFMLYLALGRHGSVRIGGPEAEPEFSTPSWFAMLFSAGMGIGLVFFGAAEPLSHFFTPPEGIAAESGAAARAAMRYSFFHYGLHPWAVYALIGLAIAYFRFNHGKKAQISEILRPLIGRWTERWPGKLVDLLAILATVGGVATSLGYGAVQIANGVSRLTGLPDSGLVRLAVIAVATVLFLASAGTGVHRGVKWLSNGNMILAAVLLAAVLLFGPTGFVFDTLTTSIGSYLNHLPGMSLRLTPFSGRTWVLDWTVFYWAWWISWAPFVGAFIARISRGRTIREFVAGVLVVPSLFGFLWFSAFGGTALFQQMFGGADLGPVVEAGVEGVAFAMFEGLPLTGLLTTVAVMLLVTFFVTSADSATLVIATMANDGKSDVRFHAKLVWGLLVSAIGAALLLSGGLEGLQSGAVLSALPFALVLCAIGVSLLRRLNADFHAERERELARRREVDRWVARSNGQPGGRAAGRASRPSTA